MEERAENAIECTARGICEMREAKCFCCGVCMKVCRVQATTKPLRLGHLIQKSYKFLSRFSKAFCQEITMETLLNRETHRRAGRSRVGNGGVATRKFRCVEIQKDICRNCGMCLSACPASAILRLDNVCVINKGKCTNCGDCVPVCPVNAVKEKFSLRRFFERHNQTD